MSDYWLIPIMVGISALVIGLAWFAWYAAGRWPEKFLRSSDVIWLEMARRNRRRDQ